MELIADLHMHTKGCDTLFDTLSIMTSTASKKGFAILLVRIMRQSLQINIPLGILMNGKTYLKN